MKLKRLFFAIGLLAFGLSFSSCSNEEGKYETKEVKIYTEKGKADHSIDLRFYSENPNVPYVGVNQFVEKFFSMEFTLNKKEQIYTYTSGKSKLIFDTKNELLSICNLTGMISNDEVDNVGTPIIKKEVVGNNSKTKVIDLNDYEILTYAGGNDAYVPLNLIDNMLGGIGSIDVTYSGGNIYYIDSDGLFLEKPSNFDDYGTDITDGYKDDVERSEDMIKYSYNQLRFTFDNLRGLTSQLIFKDINLLSLGVDGILELYYPNIKKLLLSKSMKDYKKGLVYLFAGLSDGGHTTLSDKNVMSENLIMQLLQDEDSPLFFTQFITSAIKEQSSEEKIKETKKALLGVNKDDKFYYVKDTKYNTNMAYIAFDKFVSNRNLWDKYYNGDKSVLAELEKSDTYAFVRSSLIKAKNDGVKTVVFDFTTNEGGEIYAVACVLGLINGSVSKTTENDYISSLRTQTTYYIDTNLDGKYDKDDEKFSKELGLNIVMMTSSNAFSSGNLLPALMKESGFTVVGEKTRGGSCAVSIDSTAEGIPFTRSSHIFVTDNSGDNLDDGVSVELKLVEATKDGNDYSKFFDFKTIYDYINS